MSFTEHITKETVEDEIEKYNLIGPDYDEDNDTRVKYFQKKFFFLNSFNESN